MPIISPQDIAAKTERAFPRFLQAWVRGEDDDFFPWRVRTNLSPDPKHPDLTIAAIGELHSNSKESRGWGYTVYCEHRRSRDLGRNDFPKAITVDTRDDMLRLAKKSDEFAKTCKVADLIRTDLPRLETWLRKNVSSLHALVEACEGLVAVTKYFIGNPWPDCYARQIPVQVDTKFIQRNSRVLRQWLDELLPDSAIDINEKRFERRFGLLDGEPHRAIRLLDPALIEEIELPICELSLPLRSIAQLPVANATVFIVENDLNLLTLPTFPRGLAIRGEGNAVNRLERVKWLAFNNVYYWGDIDVEGYFILSRLRNLFPDVRSVMMDTLTIESQRVFHVEGNATTPDPPTNLTNAEKEAFSYCVAHNYRLEQEKIMQHYVDEVVSELQQKMAIGN
ncbi:MAG: Wadjet anti-phage system protein JetD domain-containing protein [Planctomycetota bacterium]